MKQKNRGKIEISDCKGRKRPLKTIETKLKTEIPEPESDRNKTDTCKLSKQTEKTEER